MAAESDIDDAVLAATDASIKSGLVNTVRLSISCQNLPNLETKIRTNGICILYK